RHEVEARHEGLVEQEGDLVTGCVDAGQALGHARAVQRRVLLHQTPGEDDVLGAHGRAVAEARSLPNGHDERAVLVFPAGAGCEPRHVALLERVVDEERLVDAGWRGPARLRREERVEVAHPGGGLRGKHDRYAGLEARAAALTAAQRAGQRDQPPPKSQPSQTAPPACAPRERGRSLWQGAARRPARRRVRQLALSRTSTKTSTTPAFIIARSSAAARERSMMRWFDPNGPRSLMVT